MIAPRQDHGGGLDAAIAEFGGQRGDWLDLSTGINPQHYPLPELNERDWMELPDTTAMQTLESAARRFWNVPDAADIVAAGGASALIALVPGLREGGSASIDPATYSEHAAAFRRAGWHVGKEPAGVQVVVHPNNPDGRLWREDKRPGGRDPLLVIDESFADTQPEISHVSLTEHPRVIVLKSFGKFWGLAGLRLGFAIGAPKDIGHLRDMLGPWPVSGAALKIGALALSDPGWAADMRENLRAKATRLDDLMRQKTRAIVGGTSLFRLYEVDDASAQWRELARQNILTRIFPYSGTWLRMGLPGGEPEWQRLTSALARHK